VRHFVSFKTLLKFEPPAFEMQQDIRILKYNCNAGMIALCSGQVWWSLVHAPLRKLCQLWPAP